MCGVLVLPDSLSDARGGTIQGIGAVMKLNPYARLKQTALDFARKVVNRPVREGFSYTLDKGDDVIKLAEIYYAAKYAAELGFTLEAYVDGKRLGFRYLGKLPAYIPYEIRD